MGVKAFTTNLVAPVTRKLNIAKFKVVKYSPEICLAIGIVGGVATVVSACRATLKAGDILDKLEEDKQEIIEEEKKAEEAGETYNRGLALTNAYKDAAFGFIKLYGRSMALGAVSTAFIFCSYRTIKKRNLGLITAYTGLQEGFNKYRGRVVEKLGEEADQEFLTGAKKEKVLVKQVDPETGEIKTEKKEVRTMDQIMMEDPSNYDRVFARGLAEACQTYDDNTNIGFLLGVEKQFQYKLKTDGYVFLSDVYKALGFPVTRESRLVGWILDPANPYAHEKLSFGNIEFSKVYMKDGDYVHPTGRIEPSYVDSGYYLTFNIDGLIWNLV